MQKDGITPTTIAIDDEFLRRIDLDLTGQIPDSATITVYLADKTVDTRTKKIGELLASDAFVDRWTMFYGDLVQNVTFFFFLNDPSPPHISSFPLNNAFPI